MADPERRQYPVPQSPPNEFFIGRWVLRHGLQKYVKQAKELALEKGYRFHGSPNPLALRQITLSHYDLAAKPRADAILEQVPPEMRMTKPNLWVGEFRDNFLATNRARLRSGWIKRSLLAVLQQEKTAEPQPGPLAEERLFLASLCGVTSTITPRDEGRISVARMGILPHQEYDNKDFIHLLSEPEAITLGPLEVIREPLRQRALIRQVDVREARGA